MVREYLEALKNIFFPPLCFYCEKRIDTKDYLCEDCFKKIEFLYPPLCKGCSLPLSGKKEWCKDCEGEVKFYERVICVAFYKEPISSLLYLFKYYHYEYLGEFFAFLMIKHLLRIGFKFSNYDFISCVGLHPAREKERGYNQSAIISKIISNYFKIPFKELIFQERYRKSQTKLSLQERIENVKGSFKASDEVEGKKVILVDDVFTTGSTAKECAKVLKEKGAKSIVVLTLSKA